MLGDQSIDPAPGVSVTQVGATFELFWNPLGVLDHRSVHVDHVGCPVGPIFQVDGSTPLVA